VHTTSELDSGCIECDYTGRRPADPRLPRRARAEELSTKTTPAGAGRTAAEQNAKHRDDLLAQRREWNKRVPPVITMEVALTVFTQFLDQYPLATPEVIAVELIDRADSWEEVAAVRAALRHVLRSATPESAAARPSGPGAEQR
jgi:hypothetical protein